jgi:hypothetical protein
MNPQQPIHDAPGIAACGLLVDRHSLRSGVGRAGHASLE